MQKRRWECVWLQLLFQEDNSSDCSFASFLRLDLEEEGEDRLLRGQENVLMGGKEIEGNILEGNCGEWGVAGKSVRRRECWPVNTAPDEPARED